MGITEPLGRTQVVAYVEGLARRGWPITVVSFEKAWTTDDSKREMRARLAETGIEWVPLDYHEGGTSGGMVRDLAKALFVTARLCSTGTFGLIHCRSYLAATVGHAVRRVLGVPYLFDIRSFWLDEKVEAGVWSKSTRYTIGKRVEPYLYRDAAAVVSLTHAATAHLPGLGARGQPVEVIPTCVDLPSFARERHGSERAPHFGYVGSLGERYLIDATVAIFAHILAREPKARLQVLTQSDRSSLYAALSRHAIPPDAVAVDTVSPDQIPPRLCRMTATFSLIKPGFASAASCPTKFGESLAAGCPVVVNPGIGDCADIVERFRVGVVTAPEASAAESAARDLLDLLAEGRSVRDRCVSTAEVGFALEAAVRAYERIYRSIVARTRVKNGAPVFEEASWPS
jgi:glycosyltransferase involved in cell wall biosynthesis